MGHVATDDEYRPPAPDALDGYTPTPHGRLDTAPSLDPAVQQAARNDAEAEQVRRGVRWDGVTLDGFVNALTGYGDPAQDKMLGGHAAGILTLVVRFLAGADIEDRWRGTDLGARVVEQIPAEMTRMGFELSVQPDDDEGLDDQGGAQQAAITRVDAVRSVARRVLRMPDEWIRRIFKRDYAPGAPPPDAGSPAQPTGSAGPTGTVPGAAGSGAEPAPRVLPVIPPLPPVDEESQRIVEEIDAQLVELGALDAFREAAEYTRAYGGAGILLGVDDGVKIDLTIPLRTDQIGQVKHLTTFRGGWDGEIIAWRYYNDPREANYGMPEVYMLRNLGVPISTPAAPGEHPATPQPMPAGPAGALTFYVHESRLLIFKGKAVSRRARVQMRGWGDSVFMRVDEVLTQYSQTWQAIATIMAEWAMGVLKMEGLAEYFAANGDPQAGVPGGVGPAPVGPMGVVAQRIRAINLSKSNAHTLLIDGNEEFKREIASLSGLAEVLESFMLRLASAVDMPVSLLMGQSPGGLRAGDDDVRFFYDKVNSKIVSELLPNWRALIRLLFMAKKTSPTGGREPRKWHVKPRPLMAMTEKETAELRKMVADTDAIYIDRGVQSVPETTASRFGGAKWSMETTIDFEGRAQLDAMKRRAAELAARQPRPPIGGGPGGGGAGGSGPPVGSGGGAGGGGLPGAPGAGAGPAAGAALAGGGAPDGARALAPPNAAGQQPAMLRNPPPGPTELPAAQPMVPAPAAPTTLGHVEPIAPGSQTPLQTPPRNKTEPSGDPPGPADPERPKP